VRRAKLYFALVGFILAVAGVSLDNRPLVWTATAALAVALGLRLWLKRAEASPPAESPAPDEEAGASR
jgi:hypothetical protein